MSLPEIQRIKDMYMGKRKPSSHRLETNISLSVSLALCSASASRTQRPKALLYSYSQSSVLVKTRTVWPLKSCRVVVPATDAVYS